MPPIRNDDCAAPGLSTMHDRRGLRRRRRAGRRRRDRCHAPTPRTALELGVRRRPAHVADDEQCGVVRPIVRRVEALHFVARDRRERSLGARERTSVGCCSPNTAVANARSAIAGARSRSCCSAVSRTLRTRSSSAVGKLGRSATSANSASALSSCAVGVCSETLLCSQPLVALSSTPRYAAWSAICSAVRVVVPSVSMRGDERRGPQSCRPDRSRRPSGPEA